MKTIYINAAVRYDSQWDIKSLIPDANMRRRMSRIVKMGVASGLKCLEEAHIATPDSIITATAYGCLADSEKFLSSAISSGELVLPPTPFIQSTFNTVGSHIAILTGCHGYNMTFVDRSRSFADALVDASLEISEGKHNVLIGVMDEVTPTLQNILTRMKNVSEELPRDDSAWFFVLSDTKCECTLGQIEEISIAGLMKMGSAETLFERVKS